MAMTIKRNPQVSGHVQPQRASAGRALLARAANAVIHLTDAAQSRLDHSTWLPERGEGMSSVGAAGSAFSASLGAILPMLDWDAVRDEVDRESRTRILILGAAGSGKRTLVRAMRNEADADDHEARSNETLIDEGLFATCCVSEPLSGDSPDGLWMEEPAIQSADLVLWLLDAEAGLRSWERAALFRLRATGRPMLIVLNKCDLPQAEAVLAQCKGALGQTVIAISACDRRSVAEQLMPALVRACPNLATALGREAPAWRKEAVDRATQQAALLSGLVGLEPAPLVDIPFQLLIQMRLVLRIAAMYGEPMGGRFNRELIATVMAGAGLRCVGQQIAKVVPVIGWAGSGAIAAAGTYAIGKLAASYFEHGRNLPTPTVKVTLPQVHWPLRKEASCSH